MPRDGQRRTHLMGWSVGIGVLSVVALAVVFGLWLRPRLPGTRDSNSVAERAAADAHKRVASKYQSPGEGESLALVKKALALRNPDGVASLIRPGPLTAQEVVDFLAAMKTVDGDIKDYVWLGSIDKNGLSLEGVQVTFVGAGQSKNRLAMLTPDANGVWKVDFAAFARYVKPSWKSLLEQGAESALIRVYAAKDSYFNGPFRDERSWAAYKLASPDTEQILVGYCKRDSVQYRAMELLWQRGETAVARVTLQIHRAPEAEGVERAGVGQYEITRVLAEDWVMGDKALDEGL